MCSQAATFFVLGLVLGACVSSPAATPVAVVHRPERIRGTGAEALAPPIAARRPERIAPTAEEPAEEPVVEAADAEADAPAPDLASVDVATVDVPPPPAAGSYVMPERVELEEDVTVAREPSRARPPTSRRRLRPSSGMGGPIFSSPSVFSPSGPASSVPPPPLVE